MDPNIVHLGDSSLGSWWKGAKSDFSLFCRDKEESFVDGRWDGSVREVPHGASIGLSSHPQH